MADPDTEWVSIEEFRERIGGSLSRSFVYHLAQTHAIPAVQIGKRWLIRADAIDTLFAQQERERGQ